jgi:outer membrane protein assembly factor BamB
MNLIRSAGILILASLPFACSMPEEILPGQREAVRGTGAAGEVAGPNQVVGISLPGAVNHGAWPQRAGSPQHRIQHPALAAQPQAIWTADIGAGNGRRHRITAEPVVVDGRIYTLDSRALVMAHSTAGQPLWSRDITPENEREDDASGGGLAYDGGKLFVTSGFGTLTALNPATGAVLWTQKLGAPASGAPTVVGGMVYVATRDNRAWAVHAENGRVAWQLTGQPDVAGWVGAASPAVSGDLALFPFASGEMLAVRRAAGEPAWNAVVAGQRQGRGYSQVTDITGEPVIADGIVYAGNAVGRTVAMNLQGQRLWTAHEGATGPVWVEGGSVFLISDQAELVRLDARSGQRIWGVSLPYFTKEKAKRRKAIYANYGPVLAGGRLWVASSDGKMRGFDPQSGALMATVEMPDGAASRPVVVAGVAYIVSTGGKLMALR